MAEHDSSLSARPKRQPEPSFRHSPPPDEALTAPKKWRDNSRADRDDEAEGSSRDWEDVDHRRRMGHAGAATVIGSKKSSEKGSVSRGSTSKRRSSRQDASSSRQDFGSFFPRLNKLLEAKEHQDRSKTKASAPTKEREKRASRRSRTGDETGMSQKRPLRHNSSSLQRRIDTLPNPSLVSLLSSVTKASGNSSGSNSTITQKSYDRLNGIDSRRSKESRRRSEVDRPGRQSRLPRIPDMEKVDAFSYLEEPPADVTPESSRRPNSVHEPSEGSSLKRSSSGRSTYAEQPTTPSNAVHQDVWPHADSGISVHSSSPEPGHSKSRALSQLSHRSTHTSRMPQAVELHQSRSQQSNPSTVPDPTGVEDEQLQWRLHQQENALRDHVNHTAYSRRYHRHPEAVSHPSHVPPLPDGMQQMIPAPYPYPPPHPHMENPAAVGPLPPQPPHHLQYHRHGGSLTGYVEPDLTKTTITGYELLAKELCREQSSESKLNPAYRKFEGLNHRVLLHLQDEIAELEEELRGLDECIAQNSGVNKEGGTYPASRRSDARFGGELHYRRTDLLGRIYLKLGQYNQGLSGYGDMIRKFEPAQTDDIHAYKAWLAERVPIEEAETRFLKHESDLLAVNPAGSGFSTAQINQISSLCFPLLLLAPMMVFSVTPAYAGRLFVILVIGMAQVTVVSSTRLYTWMTPKEWAVAAAMYYTATAVVACFA